MVPDRITAQYIAFTTSYFPAFRDPAKAGMKEFWRKMMVRNMETLHYSGALQALQQLAAATSAS